MTIQPIITQLAAVEPLIESLKRQAEDFRNLLPKAVQYRHPDNWNHNHILNVNQEDKDGFIFDFQVYAGGSWDDCFQVSNLAEARPEDKSHGWAACSLLPSFEADWDDAQERALQSHLAYREDF